MKKTLLSLAATSLAASAVSAATHHITTDISVNTAWVAGDTYILDKVIYVRNGATLDIPAGTIVRGQPDATSLVAGSLVVRPDSKIQIRGTSTNPVIFTTAALDADADGKVDQVAGKFVRWSGVDAFFDADPKITPLAPTSVAENLADHDLNPVTPDTIVETTIRTMQMWGGIVVMGDGFTNNANQVDVDGDTDIDTNDLGKGVVEGLTGADAIYGGINEQHNAGIIKYVSIRHGGIGLTADKEVNALTFYAVGKDTTVENVDIYCTSDDGIEIFGGDVNVKYANINYADDDGFDVDEGWRGSAQFVFVLQGTVGGLRIGDTSLELDGEDKSESQAGVIDPLPFMKLYNFTVWHDSFDDAGFRVRAGNAGVIANSIIQYIGTTASTGTAVRIDGLAAGETAPSARDNFGTGLLQVRNVTAHGFSANYSSFTSGLLTMSSAGAVTGTFNGIAVGATNPYYPATLNRNNVGTTFNVPGISHTAAGGINPRPLLGASSLSYLTPQDVAYVPSPLLATAYRGAFDRTAASLWTSGWTALNKRGILSN
jgi:hypothetical protein